MANSGISIAWSLLCFVGLAAAPASNAQPPDAPLRFIVPTPPGGGQDLAARILADALKDEIGVRVIVENISGADGAVAAQAALSAPVRDNVIVLGNPTMTTLASLLATKLPYDPERDFAPISEIRRYMYAVAVRPDLPVTDAKSLLAWLKANPAQANFGVPALGSLPHLFALSLAQASKVSPQMIGYRGSGPLQVDLLSGNVPVAIDVLDVMTQAHRAGKLKILAVSGPRRASSLPEVPTLQEQGIDAVGEGWSVVFAPATMPADKVRWLGRAIEAAMARPDVQKRFRTANLEPVVSSIEQTEAMLAAYRSQWEPVVRAALIKR